MVVHITIREEQSKRFLLFCPKAIVIWQIDTCHITISNGSKQTLYTKFTVCGTIPYMRLLYLFIFILLALSPKNVVEVFASPVSNDCFVINTLRIGSKGPEVECLQGKVGAVTDGSFGPLTKIAVMIFQSSHGLLADGIVGPLSRNALNSVTASNIVYPTGCTSALGYSTTTGTRCDIGINPLPSSSQANGTDSVPVTVNNGVNTIAPQVQPPKVLSVFPEKVRAGDTVKIYGENFSSTGNTVRLSYSQIEDRFENLPSSDGRIISFVFQPPEVKTMNKEELLNLPRTILDKILYPVKAAGGTVDDIVAPYKNMKNEDDLRQFLNKNGHNFDEMYNKFYVTVENMYGRGTSSGPILAGLRKLSFGSNLASSENNNFLSMFRSVFEIFSPKKVFAQSPEGGTNTGIIMECTCGDGYLTFMNDFSTNGGTGLYWWSFGFIPTVGSPEISGPQIGFFNQNAGTCSIEAGEDCVDITANTAVLPWGEGL